MIYNAVTDTTDFENKVLPDQKLVHHIIKNHFAAQPLEKSLNLIDNIQVQLIEVRQ